MSDPCTLASRYFDKIMQCNSIEELQAVGAEIKADTTNLEGFIDWLRDGWISRRDAIRLPVKPFVDTLNAAGRRAYKRGEI